ncbi:MAG: hypothetical protein PHP98_11315 [Kiritimatiellae bacterium]|nr:hypothetical protein [Kiritimatiellia bacterium]
MALIKFGGGIAAIRGSIGGVTYARNRYGSYMRQRTKPVDPASAYQLDVRSNLSALVERWSTVLTQSQRDAWNNFAQQVSWINALGESIQLTGFNMFCRSNTAILQADGSIVDDGPTELVLPAADPAFVPTISAAAQEISVAFDNTLDWAKEVGGYMTLKMTRPVGPGREYLKGPMRYAGSIAGAAVAPTSPQTVSVPFAVAEGQKVLVEARIIRLDGRLSAPFCGAVSVGA